MNIFTKRYSEGVGVAGDPIHLQGRETIEERGKNMVGIHIDKK
jgi:hypothetical protein